MDMRTLTYFVVVAEELNITHAAKRLKISQPPLSCQMRNLEQELGTTLFIRGHRYLQLTDSGKLLYRRAKELVSLTQKAAQEVRALNGGINGTISIGLVEGSAPRIVSKWIDAFTAEHANVRFRIVDGNSDDLIAKMRSGQISLAIVAAPCDPTILNIIPVGQDRLAAFMSADHPLVQSHPKDTIRLEALKKEKLLVPTRKYMLDSIYHWFKELRTEPKIVCEMDNYLDIAALVEQNVGVGLFPKTDFIRNPAIVVKELAPAKPIEYDFVWLHGNPLQPAEEAFIDFVKAKTKKK